MSEGLEARDFEAFQTHLCSDLVEKEVVTGLACRAGASLTRPSHCGKAHTTPQYFGLGTQNDGVVPSGSYRDTRVLCGRRLRFNSSSCCASGNRVRAYCSCGSRRATL